MKDDIVLSALGFVDNYCVTATCVENTVYYSVHAVSESVAKAAGQIATSAMTDVVLDYLVDAVEDAPDPAIFTSIAELSAGASDFGAEFSATSLLVVGANYQGFPEQLIATAKKLAAKIELAKATVGAMTQKPADVTMIAARPETVKALNAGAKVLSFVEHQQHIRRVDKRCAGRQPDQMAAARRNLQRLAS